MIDMILGHRPEMFEIVLTSFQVIVWTRVLQASLGTVQECILGTLVSRNTPFLKPLYGGYTPNLGGNVTYQPRQKGMAAHRENIGVLCPKDNATLVCIKQTGTARIHVDIFSDQASPAHPFLTTHQQNTFRTRRPFYSYRFILE